MLQSNDNIRSLIFALHEDRDGLRSFAMRRLANLGPPAVPELIAALKNPNDEVQECVAVILRTIGQPAIPHLLEALKCSDRKLRWGAAWVLSSMGPEARDAVIGMSRKESGQSSRLREASVPKTPAAIRNQGVWSDSWLTKVREELHATRQMVGFDSVRIKHG
jgi:HEAT repeat protein